MSDMNFLVIDDDEVFSGILARGLTRRGYTVAEAHNAEEAIKLANQQKFGQITVDLHLGNDSGLTLVAPLRELQPDARMLVLTGYASIATAVQAVKDGADNYLAKPANVETILSALQSEASALQAEEALEHPTPLSVARLEWEHIQRVLAEHWRQYFRDGSRVEHASTHAAAQAGQAAGEAIRLSLRRPPPRRASHRVTPLQHIARQVLVVGYFVQRAVHIRCIDLDVCPGMVAGRKRHFFKQLFDHRVEPPCPDVFRLLVHRVRQF